MPAKLIKTDPKRDILELLDRFPVPIINHETDPPSYHFKMPDWSQGGNWREHGFKTIRGENDWEVILYYLNTHRGVKNSYQAYCGAVEKLLFFLLVEKKMMISELKRDDFEDFFKFLEQPEPDTYWVGDRHRKFDMKTSSETEKFINPDWRPFVGQYNFSLTEFRERTAAGKNVEKRELIDWGMARKAVIDVSIKIGTMFRDLFDSGYLQTIPIIPKRLKASKDGKLVSLLEHFLEKRLIDDVIELINDDLSSLKQHQPERINEIFSLIRNRFIIKLFFTTGLRIEELAKLKVGSIADINDRWVMNVHGKGDKLRQVSLYKDTMRAIKEFRSELKEGSLLLLKKKPNHYSGLIRDQKELNWPMVPQRNLSSHICVRRVDQLIKPHFEKLAEVYRKKATEPGLSEFKKNKLINDAVRLEFASAHWLRHSHGTYFTMECKRDYKAIMERLGHSKVDTTMIYTHVVDKWFSKEQQVDYSVSY